VSKDLVIGIIGGTGLTRMDNLAVTEELTVSTPFGPPSDAILKAKIWGREVFFLPRHGRGHRIPPHRINYRANVFALKSLGVEIILSVSAVGSMRESIVPGQLVFPDQFLDRTKQRPGTFFDEGLVAHVPFADPLCPHLRAKLTKAAERLSIPHHTGGTYVCIEGPQFSTRAESLFYRSLGVEVIGMTNATEARLAREAECCYATIALATDYDCWHTSEASVSVEAVMRLFAENVEKAKSIISEVVKDLGPYDCPCRSALANTITTERDAIDPEVARRLAPLVGKYL